MIKEVKELLIQELRKDMSSLEKQDKIKKISSAKSWGELGISIENGIKLLKEHGMNVVLDEADKIITENPRDYSSWDSLIGIHMTNYAPHNETIYTPQETKRKRNFAFYYSGELYEMPIVSSRNTIHMVINNEVKDINQFISMNWSSCKYAVLTPLNSISRKQIKSGNPIDTFVEGNLQLNEQCWILCPSGEEDTLKKNNPNINILGYNGESVRGYAAAFASALGYRVEPHDNFKWKDAISASSYSELMKDEPFRTDLLHANTPERAKESVGMDVSIIVSICKAIKDNNFIKSKEDIPGFMAKMQEESSGIIQISNEELERKINDYLEEHNSDQVFASDLVSTLYDYFHTSFGSFPYAYEMLEREGIHISAVHKEWIENFLQDYRGFKRVSPGLNVTGIGKFADSDEDKEFVEGMKGVCSKVCKRTSNLRPIKDRDAVLLYILLEDMVESRVKENDFGNNEFIESLSGQVIPEMANVQLEDETQRTIISQERQVENTKSRS